MFYARTMKFPDGKTEKRTKWRNNFRSSCYECGFL